MGTRWGINRTVAQIHALLFIAPRPLTAEEIAATLAVARSNVSTSLRELQGWGIVRVTHTLGDRRDYFESMGDVWEMFQVILEERKRREIDPTIGVLRECVASGNKADAATTQRLGELLDFMETMEGAYREAKSLSMADLRRFLKLRGGMRRVANLILSR
ncbi:MAG: MarR family transcriptional regulator [Candidatus Dormibacteraeota bacterium]|nr:MarR family transcriptional regulator [Candidatus Dormibacteraeota bacterium]